MRNNVLKLAVAVFGVSAALTAQADIAWTLPTSGVVTGTSAGGVAVNVSGWADAFAGQTSYTTPVNDAAGANLNQFNVNGYGGGVGITTMQGDTPDHAVGNGQEYGYCAGGAQYCDGPNEMVLFSFSETVTVKGVDIGYWANDSDISVLAYKGAADVTSVKAGLDASNWNGILAAGDFETGADGWHVINHYWNFTPTGPDSTSYDISGDTTNVSSSYWLVGTLNKQFDDVVDGDYPDFIKIAGLTGVTSSPPVYPPGEMGVPEPATFLLLAVR